MIEYNGFDRIKQNLAVSEGEWGDEGGSEGMKEFFCKIKFILALSSKTQCTMNQVVLNKVQFLVKGYVSEGKHISVEIYL